MPGGSGFDSAYYLETGGAKSEGDGLFNPGPGGMFFTLSASAGAGQVDSCETLSATVKSEGDWTENSLDSYTLTNGLSVYSGYAECDAWYNPPMHHANTDSSSAYVSQAITLSP